MISPFAWLPWLFWNGTPVYPNHGGTVYERTPDKFIVSNNTTAGRTITRTDEGIEL